LPPRHRARQQSVYSVIGHAAEAQLDVGLGEERLECLDGGEMAARVIAHGDVDAGQVLGTLDV
jgi:hypothetical protein